MAQRLWGVPFLLRALHEHRDRRPKTHITKTLRRTRVRARQDLWCAAGGYQLARLLSQLCE